MKVFKFGGASVKDADSVRNVGRIINTSNASEILVVISAMGKTTNAFEKLVNAWYNKNSEEKDKNLEVIKIFHRNIIRELISDSNKHTFDEIDNIFLEIECMLETDPDPQYDFDFLYDQLVCFGELLSTRIVSAYLNESGIPNRWMDCRNFIITDNNYRNARVAWHVTGDLISKKLLPIAKKQLIITQGFLGRSEDNTTTTLGRDGSDYSAAIFAWAMQADYVTIWKDVSGVMNADPKRISNAVLFNELSFNETIELAFYGANIIHPKTIQPLRDKQIPLYVKSFYNPTHPGTRIGVESSNLNIPVYIFKDNQVLVSISTRDFSFIVENYISEIFDVLSELKIQVNMMQNSAISFRLCVNDAAEKMEQFQERLSRQFDIYIQRGLQLISIRNPNEKEEVLSGKSIIMQQRTSDMWQILTD